MYDRENDKRTSYLILWTYAILMACILFLIGSCASKESTNTIVQTPDIVKPQSEPTPEIPVPVPDPEPLVIKIGYSKFPYPPLHYINESKDLVGFDPALAKAAAGIMGAEIEFIPINWSQRADLLESGEVDALWGGLERASLDERVVKFTKAYLRSNIVLLMEADRNYAKFEDLQGQNVCALNFTPAFDYLQAYNRDVIKSRRSFTPPDYHELLTALTSGEFDCMITDTSFAAFYQKATGETFKMSESLMGSSYAVAVRIGDTDLFDLLQAALDELEAGGEVTRLADTWINNP